MEKLKQLVKVREHRSQIIKDISESDNRYFDNKNFAGCIELYYDRDKRPVVKNKSFAGIIELDNIRLVFSEKVETNFFHLLSYVNLQRGEDFFFDPDAVIEIKEGGAFVEFIGRLFLNELESIVQRGLLRKHINRRNDIKYIKGKLQVAAQLQNDIKKTVRFNCSYGDVTYDNLENQIVMKALGILITRISGNKQIKERLARYHLMLREHIDSRGITYHDCRRVNRSRLNAHYEEILCYSRLILEDAHIRTMETGLTRGFNFLVNMDKVYEKFITNIFTDIVSEKYCEMGYSVSSQQRFADLVEEKKSLVTIPDIVVRDEQMPIYPQIPFIIDAKYKDPGTKKAPNSDYYQVIIYALAIKSSIVCCLIYPKVSQDSDVMLPELTLRRDPLSDDPTMKVKLVAVSIDLMIEDDMEYDDYIKATKIQAKSIMDQLIDYQERVRANDGKSNLQVFST